MKPIKFLLAAALFTSLATFSFAGPSPQYRATQTTNQKAQKTDTAPQATKVCANCDCSGMKHA
jgi:hypothetical protein